MKTVLFIFVSLGLNSAFGYPNTDDHRIVFPESKESEELRISESRCETYSTCTVDPKHEFPYTALLGWKSRKDGSFAFLCGGTLISEKFIITTAHCTNAKSEDYESMTPAIVRLGAYNISSSSNEKDVQDFSIAEIIRHPSYKPPKVYNDLAIIRLSNKVKFTDAVRPACLWSKPIPKYQKVVLSGWGITTESDGKLIEVVEKVNLEILEQPECTEHYPIEKRFADGFTDDLLCAGNGAKDLCQGSSGSPLVIKEGSPKCSSQLVGVSTLGKGCSPSVPGVYGNIKHHIDWIETVIWS